MADLSNITFYLRIGEDLPTDDSVHVTLYRDGPGSSPEQAVGLVVPTGSVSKGPGRTNGKSQPYQGTINTTVPNAIMWT